MKAQDEKSISISKEQAEDLMDYYMLQVSKVTDEINDLKAQLVHAENRRKNFMHQIDRFKLSLGESYLVGVVSNEERKNKDKSYKVEWSVIDKIIYVLSSANKYLTTREITNVIFNCEPELKQSKTFDRLQKDIATNLINKIRDEVIFQRHKLDYNKDYYYGLRSWFDENGSPKEGYIEKTK